MSGEISESKTDDYSTSAVPDSGTISGIRLGLILAAFIVTLPTLLLGSELGITLGFSLGLWSFAIGAGILCFVGCLTAVIAATTRLSTYMLLQFAFGHRGGKIVTVLIILALLGWFGVTVQLFGKTTSVFIRDIFDVELSELIFRFAGAAIMILTASFGIKSLGKLSNLAVPILFIALVATVIYAMREFPAANIWESSPRQGMGLGIAISSVVGSFILGVIHLPDICRYATNVFHGCLAAIIGFGIVFPIVLIATAILGLLTNNKDVLQIMLLLGLGLPALIVIVFALWTTGTTNLFSNSIAWATILPFSYKKLVLAAGIVGSVFAFLGIMNHFIPFLLFLGIIIPPVAGVYFADYFLLNGKHYKTENLVNVRPYSINAFVAWIVAAIVGYATVKGYLRLSGISSIDSILVAFVGYWLLEKLGSVRVRLQN